jgi:hypothetical protein
MKQILIQLEDSVAQELERVAPGKGRKRSEFLRSVIARALLEVREVGTRRAYSRWPDGLPAFDPAEWASEEEAIRPPQQRRRAGSRRTPRRKGRG